MCDLQTPSDTSLYYFSGRWKKKLESYYDLFLECEKQKSDESKRRGHSIKSSDLLRFEGSFRRVDVH